MQKETGGDPLACSLWQERQVASCEPLRVGETTSTVTDLVLKAVAFISKLHPCKGLTHSTYKHKQTKEYLPRERFYCNFVFVKPQDKDSRKQEAYAEMCIFASKA